MINKSPLTPLCKRGGIIIVIILIFLSLTGTAFAAEVKNLQSTQRGNRVLFKFDVVGEEKETDVTVKLTINGKEYKEKDLHLEGDFGKVKTGKDRKIYWNVLQDFPRGYSGNLDVEITAGPKVVAKPKVVAGMIYVKGSCFQMGDTFRDSVSDEKPVHEVCVDDYYIDKYEVTQKVYKEVIGNNPSYFKGDNNPVENVTWNDAKNYCKKTGKRFPTEAEWEYAARSGGKGEKWAGTNNESGLGEYGWYSNNSGKKPHPVGQKKANGLGIYDMSGNVREWVSDGYEKDYYKNSPTWNPKGPNSGYYRVLRGGSWYNNPINLRTANRHESNAGGRNSGYGFRCARTP